jgi:hypothetical protein
MLNNDCFSIRPVGDGQPAVAEICRDRDGLLVAGSPVKAELPQLLSMPRVCEQFLLLKCSHASLSVTEKCSH